jgi:hypothetical protein
MKNIDKELEMLSADFDDNLDHYTDEFSLTKMFKKSGVINKVTQAMLLFTLSAGAFAKGPSPQDIGDMIAGHQPVAAQQVENTPDFFDVDNLDVLTPEMAANAPETGLTGVFKMHETGRPVVLYQNGTIDVNELDMEMVNNLNEFDGHLINLGIKNMMKEGSEPYAMTYHGTTAMKMTTSKKALSGAHPEEFNAEKTPTLLEYEDELVSSHEYAHLSKDQLEHKEEIRNDKKLSINFGTSLVSEHGSDLYMVLNTAKNHNLDLKTTQKMFEELANFREETYVKNLDLSHATFGAVRSFSESLTPENFDSIMKNSSEELLEFTGEYGMEVHEQMSVTNALSRIKKHHIMSDVKKIRETGEPLTVEDSSVFNRLKDSEIFSKHDIFEKTGYSEYVQRVSEKMDRENLNAKTAVFRSEETGNHVRGLNQINILNNFEEVMKNQEPLNNMTEMLALKGQETKLLNEIGLEVETKLAESKETPENDFKQNNIQRYTR